jgi:hypothetical protein
MGKPPSEDRVVKAVVAGFRSFTGDNAAAFHDPARRDRGRRRPGLGAYPLHARTGGC